MSASALLSRTRNELPYTTGVVVDYLDEGESLLRIDAVIYVERKSQKGIVITQEIIEGANHFFSGKEEELIDTCATYLDKRLGLIEGGVEETMLLR